MKLAIGSHNRDARDLVWFRARSSLPLIELKARLLAGEPVAEWSPYPDSLESRARPFERIAALLADARAAGVALEFFEFFDGDDVAELPADLGEKRVTEQVARNMIESWRGTREEEFPAGELSNVAEFVECVVCGRHGRSRPVDPRSKDLALFEARPEGWLVRLGDPPLLLCSEACSRRLNLTTPP